MSFRRMSTVYEGQDNGNGGSGRNDYLYRYACSLRARAVSRTDAEYEVQAENQHACVPPLPEAEVTCCINSAYEHPEGRSHGFAGSIGDQGSAVGAAKAPVAHSYRLQLANVQLPEPPDLTCPEMVAKQIRSMFRPGELANVITTSKDGSPYGSGIIEVPEQISEDADEFLNEADPEAGAWVRINPTDGRHRERGKKAETDADVTVFRNVLVECDPEGAKDMSPEELSEAKRWQFSRIVALRLPCACVVDSGNKSVHAIVRVSDEGEELTREEWEERRDLVYSVCDANGLSHDPSCKNPSRMCRLAGARRGTRVQTLLAVGCGMPTFHAWNQWVTEQIENAKAVQRRSGHVSGQPPIHRQVADWLMSDCGAQFVAGVPVVRNGLCYSAGLFYLERRIADEFPNLKRAQRSEALSLVTLQAPRSSETNPRYVGFTNGVLDIQDMQLHPEGVPAVVTNQIPHPWNPQAKCPTVDTFLDSVSCGDAATRANLEELAGHCLYRGREFQVFWVLVGGGSNGKSTFYAALANMLGMGNVTAMQPEDLDKRFQAASIAGKLAVLADDATSRTISEDLSAAIKRISAGNIIHTDVKNHDGMDFAPYATLVLGYNTFPTIKSNDYGFMRRLQPIPFRATFREGQKGYDPFVAEKLKTEEAAERLIVLAAMGLRRLFEQGSPTFSKEADALKAAVREDNDSVLAWVNIDAVTKEQVLGQTSREVYGTYTSWCDDCGMQKKTLAQFRRQITELLGVRTEPKYDRTGTKRVYVPR